MKTRTVPTPPALAVVTNSRVVTLMAWVSVSVSGPPVPLLPRSLVDRVRVAVPTKPAAGV